MRKIIPIGAKFNKLEVISDEIIRANTKTGLKIKYQTCRCECGKTKDIMSYNIHKTISCGCSKTYQKNNLKHGLSRNSIYPIFRNMITRAQDLNVEVYEKWNGSDKVNNFIEWANENGYKKGWHLMRIDTEKGFIPSNIIFRNKKKIVKKIKIY